MRVVRVGRDGQHLGVNVVEVLDVVCEGDNFGRAHKGKVKGVEQQHDPFA
jgi:hypothetical protein